MLVRMDERRFDVFLSYNSSDRPAVSHIAERLRAQRLEPWWDGWALTPGGPWQEEIVEGLRTSGACAVMVGAAGLGPWAREELAVAQDRAAKDRKFRIFMVLLPGAPELSDPSLAFLATRTWVDLRAGVADHDGLQDLASAITGAPRPRETGAASPDTCPYRGLQVFEEEHSEFFFGRELDIAAVVERLKMSRFLAVLGSSGTGKSSMLRAGLVPAVRRGALPGSEAWTVRVFSPGARPLGNLAAQMTRLFVEAPMQQTLDSLRDDERSLDLAATLGLGDRPPADRVLLVVDQFEELFTLCDDDGERAAFLSNLLYAATIPGGRVLVVLGMRADFYHRCAPYQELRVLVAAQQFLVGPLGDDGLRRAMEEPAARVGLELEPGLVETIMADVESPGTLPLLEDVLLEVWERRRGTMLTLESYVASGGLQGAMAQRANATYASLPPAHQQIARRVLLRLIQPGQGADDTRRRAEMAELLASSDNEEEVEAVVRVLADGRLITVGLDDVDGKRVVDLTHEALIRGWAELRAWIDEDREALRAQRHLTESADEWDRRGRQPDDLYDGARLAYWAERPLSVLNELERDFVTESRAAETREKAAAGVRVRLVVGGVMVAIASVAVVALIGLRSVAGQRDIARSRQLAVEATTALLTDPARGLRLAVEAVAIKPTREGQRVLRQAAVTPGSRTEVLLGHQDDVTTAEFSPDGRRIVSSSVDGTLRVWDWVGGGEPTVLRGHVGAVSGADFSPDGRRVVSAGADGTVRVWDWAGGGEPTVLRGHEGSAYSPEFSADGRRVVSAGADGTLRVWDVAGGGDPVVLRGHEGTVWSAGFSPDSRWALSAGSDRTVRVWDWAAGGEPTVLRGHEDEVWSAAFSPDGRLVVSTGKDRTIRVWEWTGGGEPIVLRGHDDGVEGAVFSPDGRLVASAGDDRTIRVWDWANGVESQVLRGHEGAVWTALFSPDGRRIVSASEDDTVRVWDWAWGGPLQVLRGHEGVVWGAFFSPDARRVVSAGEDGTVRVWNLEGNKEPIVLRGQSGAAFGAAFSPDGHRIVGAGEDGTVRVWNLPGGGEPTVLRGHQGIVFGADFSPDGRLVVSSGADGTVRVWNWTSGGAPTVLRGHEGNVFEARFSPDGRRVASAGEDGTVRIWDLAGAREPTVLRGHEGKVLGASFSPDGRRVASAGEDGTVRIWDLAGGGEPTVLRGDDGPVWSARFSADGQLLVSAGGDGTIRVWEWSTNEEPAVLGRAAASSSAAFTPDGGEVVSAHSDGTVRVWDCSVCGSLERLIALARSPVGP